jgi:hypothetical protein
MRPQSRESPNVGNFETPKKPFGCGLCGEVQSISYKGEGGGFPQVRAMMSLVSLSCPLLVLAPKVPQLCTKHFVLVLCRPV